MGSAHPPRLVRMDYAPKGATAHLALVGKGITFDTGGISIKPAANMDEMKADMGGAAAVIGAVQTIARLGLPIRVTGWVPTAENMPSGTAQRPGDVITMFDGTTVEAEGGWMEDPAFAFTMVATIECEGGLIDFRLGREPELVVVVDGEPGPIVAGDAYPTGTGYDHEVAALVAAILAKSENAPVTLSDAARTQRLLLREIADLR